MTGPKTEASSAKGVKVGGPSLSAKLLLIRVWWCRKDTTLTEHRRD